MIKIAVVCAVVVMSTGAFEVHKSANITGYSVPDTNLGRLVKRIDAPVQFVGFSRVDSTHGYLRDVSFGAGNVMNFLFAPEMDCFLANHQKDDLRATYEIWEQENSGKIERINRATRVISLKTGDDTKTWAQKELQDTELLTLHHLKLQEAKKFMMRDDRLH